MMRTGYVLTISSGPVLIDAESIGNNVGSILSIQLREGANGVGESEFEE